MKTYVESNAPFQILQIKRSSNGLKYLVELGENIQWAEKEDLVENYAWEMINFFEDRLLGREEDKSNLYVRY